MSDPAEDPCSEIETGDYDLSWHIGGLFIILATSGVAVLIPVLLSNHSSAKVPRTFFTIIKCFGAGVILATGFIHMITPAIENLTNECLGKPWIGDYESFPTLFALVALLLMHLIEFFADAFFSNSRQSVPIKVTPKLSGPKGKSHEDHSHQPEGDRSLTVTQIISIRGGETKKDLDGDDDSLKPPPAILSSDDFATSHVHGFIMKDKLKVSTIVMEIGIALHSVIIGVALGVAVDPEFQSFLIALVFHQTFEGLALGAVIAETKFERAWASFSGVAVYALSTPLGIAIGIGIHSTYNPNSTSALLSMGIIDGLSAGVLIYNGIVHLLVPTFLDPKFLSDSVLSKAVHFASLYLGAGTMAFIGKYA
mmetsp:Transcript_16788/g.27773  ORF Transcript_16788/g.27773 Transcript_16788/m.27773 type:complete len:366 (+) Transcript_16788:99-1196(+)|eukprot:CAMPEP_0184644144 /NCGR_PEP_ID=MMETSP0308-20130426/900_1 /TAXON_ID=38269 /ORGANISM="Gloeochaete witrockiana, Strain SAG 46.84" /LENGTH=365 /DNA_ID=CAMNT_0027072505 /DNA_START=98 /DNA_END=1195 /DNA_ORIENTATION=-